MWGIKNAHIFLPMFAPTLLPFFFSINEALKRLITCVLLLLLLNDIVFVGVFVWLLFATFLQFLVFLPRVLFYPHTHIFFLLGA